MATRSGSQNEAIAGQAAGSGVEDRVVGDPNLSAARPVNVPSELIVDYDLYTAPADWDLQLEVAKRMHAGPDIVWTARNGGHWIFTRAEDIEVAQRDGDRFSMREIVVPPGVSGDRRAIPLETDEPDHAHYRAVVAPLFAPRRIQVLESDVRELAGQLTDSLKQRGRCEFVNDYATQLPILVFMRLGDIPAADREMLLGVVTKMVRPEKLEDMAEGHAALHAYCANLMEQRRDSDRDDFVSWIMRGRMMGRELTELERASMVMAILSGGLDTVTAAMSFTARFLAQSPLHCRQLVDRPDLIARAVDELLRRFPIANTARVITRDFNYKELLFKAGDRVLIPNMLHGLDDRRFPNAATVDFERRCRIATFGNGTHFCLGAGLARMEIRIFIEEWLKRIPEFSLDPQDPPLVRGGVVNGVAHLPIVW